jgi:nucleotide-binding universal stress UspA family protein
MTYRSLLVHLDLDPLCPARTQAAIGLARQLNAHLVGVAPTGALDLPVAVGVGAALGEYASLAWETLRDRAAEAAQSFREQCRFAGLPSFEAVVDVEEHARSLVHHAHCSDLILLTQPDPQSPAHRLTRAMVEQVLIYSARPTLVLPYAGRTERIGRSVMVAWDDSREAARAVSDALPMLRGASRVDVVAWREGASGTPPQRAYLDAMHRWLRWQGVSAEMHMETTEIAIGEAILSRAADMGADLIVMGAYGHARWTERVLGGATRGLLASMTVPVLMSH